MFFVKKVNLSVFFSTTLIYNNINPTKMISYTFSGICIGYGIYLLLNGGLL